MPDLVIFGLEFENNIRIFEIITLEFVLMQNFVKKMPKFGTKNALLGYFLARILKLLSFEISTLEFVKNVSLTHTVNFGIRSAFF